MAIRPNTLLFPFLLFFLLLQSAASISGMPVEDDGSMLLAFKAGVSGDHNGALAVWDSPDVCNWTGVACNAVTRRVVKLILSDQKLSGEVSPALGNLSHLRTLDLSGNHFAGSVPPELGNLSHLRILDLSGNHFAGSVPPELGKLTQLEQLSLGENQLEGSIPAELMRVRSLVYLNLGGNNLSRNIPAAIFCNLSALQYFDVSSNYLDGEIPIRADCPPELGNLSHLRILDLSGNHFAGSVPPELGKLTQLEQLSLGENQLEGSIPAELMRVRSLVYLNLGGNNLSRNIPAAIFCNLSALQYFDVSSNYLDGEIPIRADCPPELGNLSHLRILDLSGNQFTGSVPPELGKLTQLEQLSLGENQLEGSIPAELMSVRRLVYLNLGGNNLSRNIPAAIFCNLSALQYFDVSSNYLDGEIPIRADCPLPDLELLVLFTNNLRGGIPRSLSNSTKLRWLLLQNNLLTGELPSDDMFGGMSRLQFLHLSFNSLSSLRNNTSIEPFFASLANCTGLKELGIAGNDLAGTIPPVVGRLSPSLMQLHLELNRIYGPIPANLSDLANLTTLEISHNLLNGSIPQGIAAMLQLEWLDLSNNLLSGDIPPSLGTTPRLELVDFSQNRLTGAIPPSIVQCITLQNLDLSHNMLRGEIPAGLSRLCGLLDLNLAGNQLSGVIAATIGDMVRLQVLNLSSNRLSGSIPPQLGQCVELEYLDVSCNGLSGALPRSLEKAASLRRVNFSYNSFCGEVPSGGAFAGFPADAFLGDSGLCAGTESMAPGLARCSGVHNGNLSHHNRRVVLPVVLTFAISFTMAIIVLAACRAVGRDGRRSAPLGGGEPSKMGDHPRISQRELSEATGGFEESRLIGAGRFGRVYDGTLHDGTRVAVKVLDPMTGGGGKSFKRECDVLRRTRHRNLVRVVTACSQPNFHALVLPLMTNGSLESHMYPRDGGPGPGHGMDLARLVAIVSNIAEGLNYLHHYAPVRVIHCDLKPSNVLLDDDMTAVVSDFGIARLVKDMGDDDITCSTDPCNSIAGLLQGSVGYIAPEYGLGGHPSTEGDVYSFGVMLLELITGKRPTDVLFQEGLTLHDWVRRRHPHDVTAIIAESWLAATDEMSAVQAVHVVAKLIDLGIACTQRSPLVRPTMVEVCYAVAHLKDSSS